jgi:Interferon-induced transmembrane protein/zinc-ribbon domain
MRCNQCGAENHDTSQFCASCGQQLAGGMTPVGAPFPQTPVMDGPGHPASAHLAQSILVTLFCCMPLGVVAIVFSAMAMGKNSSGDYAGAHADAKKASLFGWIGFGIGAVAVVIYVIMGVLAASAGY